MQFYVGQSNERWQPGSGQRGGGQVPPDGAGRVEFKSATSIT